MKKIGIVILIVILSLSILMYLLVTPIIFVFDKDVDINVDKDNLRKDVQVLVSEDPSRNYKNTGSLNRVASYIFKEFEKLKCQVKFQTFQVNGIEYKNVICSFFPEKKEKVITGAHYDVAGDLPGADDNASGVAGLLEIARLVSKSDLDIDYGIEFVAYTLEEMPYFTTENMGSVIHSKSIKDGNTKVKVMISLEMIGYFTDLEGSQKYPYKQMKLYYPNKGDFITVVGKLGQSTITRKVKKHIKQVSDIPTYSLNGFSSIKGIENSDHRSYWNDGYKAVMITDTSFYRNPNYHKATDTINTLDFDKMAEVVKGVYWAVVNM